MIELLVSVTITLAVSGGVFAIVNPARGTFQAQPEVADLQQRLRVGVATLSSAISRAGAGPMTGPRTGPLAQFFAPVLPYRQGGNGALDDGDVRFREGAITLITVLPTAAQATIRDGLAGESADVRVLIGPGCPASVSDRLCGFAEGMDVIVFNAAGHFDTFTVTNAVGEVLSLRHNQRGALSTTYQPGATIAEVGVDVYYHDHVTNRLMHYDGRPSGAAVPVVDNVVALRFEYAGDERPPDFRMPGTSDRSTTYGPSPPALDERVGTSWPPGENCVFTAVGAPDAVQVPRLPSIGGGTDGVSALQDPRNSNTSLTDGPWCPDPAAGNRWDADLLRIRTITVTVRVQAALAALRGADRLLFTNPGTSLGAGHLAPDREIRFALSPRNLNLDR